MKSAKGGRKANRNGVTLIEVLVIVAIGLVLGMLLGAGIQERRNEARQIQCMNNMKQMGLAILNFDASHGNLPYYHDGTKKSWIHSLVPYLDVGAIYEELEAGNVKPEEIYLSILVCPSDDTAVKKSGQTSYVANVGYIDSNIWEKEDLSQLKTTHSPENVEVYNWAPADETDKDLKITLATGVFHRPVKILRMGVERISAGDGTASTILLSENVQATNWWGMSIGECGFGAKLDIAKFVDSTKPDAPLELDAVSKRHFSTASLPNRSLDRAKAGLSPRPSSMHNGYVVVLFADGRVLRMSSDVDPTLYYRLLTSDGTRYGQSEIDQDSF